jgi:L-alanine-DL-glutamate epimerase-like enolase superfamily enzyme
MKVEIKPYILKLKYPFGISGNTRTETPVVFIKISHDNIYGIGEASLPPYLGYYQNDILSVFNSFNFSQYSINDLDRLLTDFKNHSINCMPALAALDIALNDWICKKNKTSCWNMLGVNIDDMGYNAMTIGIDVPEVIEQKVKEASSFKVLKVKIGSDNDRELVSTIRKFSDMPIIADANQGLKNKEDALELCKWLYDLNCLLIEQPLNKIDLESHAWLSERSPIPVIADESFKKLDDLVHIKNSFSGINIKLMKCGGLGPANEIAKLARKNGLKILMGCMNESSCANFAAAQIAPLADWVDLDGPFLINNNPFEDFEMNEGKIVLSSTPGLGLVVKNEINLF